MGNRLYVVFQETNFIRVIKDLDKFQKVCDIHLDQLSDPWDLGSCEQQHCLYIADGDRNNCIWKVDPKTNQTEKFVSDLKKPHKFTVTSTGLIVIPKWTPSQIEIVETDRSEKKVSIIKLPEDMLEPYDALQISSDTLIVAHVHQKCMQQRICRVKFKNDKSELATKILWSYPPKNANKNRKTNHFDEMVLDSQDQNILYVTDQNNQMIIILDIHGKCLHIFRTHSLPYRFCYSRNLQRLLVGHFGAISIYQREGTGEEVKMQLRRTFACERTLTEKYSPLFEQPKKSRIEWIVDNESQIQVGEFVVSGMTELQSKLYVVLREQSIIRLFDCKNSFKELPPIQTNEVSCGNSLSDPWFIGACSNNNCLYITDRKRKCVIKVANPEKKKPDISLFKSYLGDPYRLSVTSEGRILIPVWPASLEIYNAEGNQEDIVHLPDGMREPCHAIEMEKNTFVVSHGDEKSELHRICNVKWGKKNVVEVVWSYGSERGNKLLQLNRPRNVVTDRKDRIFISDEGNRRITQLDKDGNLLSMKEKLSKNLK